MKPSMENGSLPDLIKSNFIADIAAIPIIYCDKNLKYLFVNKEYAKIHEMEQNKIIGRNIKEIVSSDAYSSIQSYLEALFKGEEVRFEKWINQKVGKRFYNVTYTPLKENNQVTSFIGVIIDHTEEKIAVDYLRKNEMMLAASQKLAKVGSWELDLSIKEDINKNILWWSDETYYIFGFEPHSVEVSSELFFSLVPQDDRENIRKQLQHALDNATPYSVEHGIIRPDGTRRIAREFGDIIRNERGEPLRIIGTVLDITETKNTEEALKDAARKKDEFLAMLAHELRNPLAPINNACAILHSGKSKEKTQEAIDIICEQSKHISRLVDDLLDIARITKGKIELRKEYVELNKVIDSAVETVKPLIMEKGHHLKINIPIERISIYGDKARLIQVIANLLNNAAKYTKDNGNIELSLSKKGNLAVIRVRDNGIGIEPGMLKRIFLMFEQVDSSIERSQGGLGIGLTLVETLVKMHDGSIDIYSEGLGKGCDCTVKLPIAEKLPVQEEAPIVEDLEKQLFSYRILVVDDNEASARTLGWSLEIMGHEVRIALRGTDAIEIANSFKPDFVLLDIGLPGMNGYEVCRAMKQNPELRNTVFIAQTGWGQKEHKEHAQEAGFQYHLIKPIDINTLKDIISARATASTSH